MEDFRGQEFSQILAESEAEWTDKQVDKITFIIAGLKKMKPFQYLLGYADFMDLRFRVEPGVLIPRGETEELVRWILEDLKDGSSQAITSRILDIGCGSGIIGITLAKHLPESKVTCVDKYDTPIRLTKYNARANEVSLKVLEMDALDPKPIWDDEYFEVIVSNPPYVTEKQKRQISVNVLDHEPSEALFVSDEDPLVFYRSIGVFAKDALLPAGRLYFEINEELAIETKDMLSTYFEIVEIRQDIHGKDRMIKAYNES
jgi:release factor glutamine methyltransferase